MLPTHSTVSASGKNWQQQQQQQQQQRQHRYVMPLIDVCLETAAGNYVVSGRERELYYDKQNVYRGGWCEVGCDHRHVACHVQLLTPYTELKADMCGRGRTLKQDTRRALQL